MAESPNTNTEIIHKPTGAIHARPNYKFEPFTASEKKLSNICFANSAKQGFLAKKYFIPIDVVFDLLGNEKSHNREWLEEVGDSLVGKKIEWNIFGQDNTRDWGVCTFFSAFGITRGKVWYRLNDEAVEQMKDSEIYGRFALEIEKDMTNVYAINLYEHLIGHISLHPDEPEVELEPIDVEDLRYKVYDARGTSYGEFKVLKKRVIVPSIQMVNDITDIKVEADYIRKGRPVKQVIFTVKRKKHYQMALPYTRVPEDAVESEADEEKELQIINLLTDHGVSKRKAKTLATKFDADHITSNLNYVLEQKEAGKDIKGLGGYIVKAIEEDYRPKKTPAEIKKEEENKKRAAEARKKKAEAAAVQAREEYVKERKIAWDRYRQGVYQDYIRSLTKVERDKFKAHLLETLDERDAANVRAQSLSWAGTGFAVIRVMPHLFDSDPKFSSEEEFEKGWDRRREFKEAA